MTSWISLNISLMYALWPVGNWMFFSGVKEYLATKFVWLFIIHLFWQISITVPLSVCLLARSRLNRLRILKNVLAFCSKWLSTKLSWSGIKITKLRSLALEIYEYKPGVFKQNFTMKNCPYDFRDTSILERTRCVFPCRIIDVSQLRCVLFY